jgi:hypothetical protein
MGGITVRGSRRGAAAARAWKKKVSGTSTKRSNVSKTGMSVAQVRAITNPEVKKGSPFWEAGFTTDFTIVPGRKTDFTPITGGKTETGKVLPFDYAEKHAQGFGVTQPESLSEGLTNVYGGDAGIIKDEKTGAIIVFDAEEDEALLIEPAGGLLPVEKKRIIHEVDIAGDMPNIGSSIIGEQTPDGQPKASGGWNIFAPTIEGGYEEGDIDTSTGGGGGGVLSTGMLLVVGVIVVVLVMLFGGRK